MRASALLFGLLVATSACTTSTVAPSSGTDAKTAPVDAAPPSVTFALGRYEILRGAHTLAVTATDDVAITRTELLVDGTKVGESKSEPFAIDWDSAAVGDGVHSLRVVAFDAAGNTGESDEVPAVIVNAGKVPTYEETKSVVDGQISGTFKIPADWDGNEETIDLKFHFTMPAGMKRAIAVLAWEPGQSFDVNFSMGTGWCPDSGVMKREATKRGGEVVLEHAPGAALEQTQWFIHINATNAAAMKGKSFPFKARVAVLP